ncbi:MAG: oxygen-dependent coproporphyrinogen oxidase [Gammaproteobacteria bacterium]|nr:oxygen-dependent coproporphyrinogen oxidase [Gammaproteobacteria bacterium]
MKSSAAANPSKNKVINPGQLTAARELLVRWQNQITVALEQYESNPFTVEVWQYEQGSGGGESRSFSGGKVIEKAAVNFSDINGLTLPAAATERKPELAGKTFSAVGVSTITHPCNPFVATSHANLRCITVTENDQILDWWFGGGFDLTPFFDDEQDTQNWHDHAHTACQPFGDDLYPRFKKWADDYFYLPHRQEPRGIGGLFFDDFNELSFDRCLELIESVGDHYVQAYTEVIDRHKDDTYGDKERDHQLKRRGRYVEFNLLYDRGTKFGLQSGGRVESILASLPPLVKWS